MFSVSIISSFLSVWCLYAISERIELVKRGITLVLSKNKKVARIAAFLFFINATLCFITALGGVTGFFVSTGLWSTIACCVILFAPFSTVKMYHLLILIMIVIGLELNNFFTV